MHPLSSKQLILIMKLREELGFRKLSPRDIQLLNINSATIMIEDLMNVKHNQTQRNAKAN